MCFSTIGRQCSITFMSGLPVCHTSDLAVPRPLCGETRSNRGRGTAKSEVWQTSLGTCFLSCVRSSFVTMPQVYIYTYKPALDRGWYILPNSERWHRAQLFSAYVNAERFKMSEITSKVNRQHRNATYRTNIQPNASENIGTHRLLTILWLPK